MGYTPLPPQKSSRLCLGGQSPPNEGTSSVKVLFLLPTHCHQCILFTQQYFHTAFYAARRACPWILKASFLRAPTSHKTWIGAHISLADLRFVIGGCHGERKYRYHASLLAQPWVLESNALRELANGDPAVTLLASQLLLLTTLLFSPLRGTITFPPHLSMITLGRNSQIPDTSSYNLIIMSPSYFLYVESKAWNQCYNLFTGDTVGQFYTV